MLTHVQSSLFSPGASDPRGYLHEIRICFSTSASALALTWGKEILLLPPLRLERRQQTRGVQRGQQQRGGSQQSARLFSAKNMKSFSWGMSLFLRGWHRAQSSLLDEGKLDQKVLKMLASALQPHHTCERPSCQKQLPWVTCEFAPTGAVAEERTRPHQQGGNVAEASPWQSGAAVGPRLPPACAWRCSGSL